MAAGATLGAVGVTAGGTIGATGAPARGATAAAGGCGLARVRLGGMISNQEFLSKVRRKKDLIFFSRKKNLIISFRKYQKIYI